MLNSRRKFHPGQAHHELPRATCVQLIGPDVGCADPHAPPVQDPPSQDPAALQISRVLTRRASSARCAQPDAALRAQPEALIEQAVLREIDDHVMSLAGGPLHFTWGCTSHDETPVVVDVVQDNGGMGSELSQVLVWRGARFVPLADAAVAAITAETAAERAAVK